MNSSVGPDEDGYQPPPWCENSIVAWLQESKSSRDGVKKKSIRSIVIPHHWLIRTSNSRDFTCNFWYRFSSSMNPTRHQSIMAAMQLAQQPQELKTDAYPGSGDDPLDT